MNGWYKDAANCTPPTAQITLNRIMVERVTLYRHIPPPGDKIPISVEPFLVDDLLHIEDYIKWEVRRLRSN